MHIDEKCVDTRVKPYITLCLYLVFFTKPKKANKRVVLHWAVYLSFKLPLDSIYHNSKIFYNFASPSVWLKKFRWWIILWIRIEKKIRLPVYGSFLKIQTNFSIGAHAPTSMKTPPALLSNRPLTKTSHDIKNWGRSTNSLSLKHRFIIRNRAKIQTSRVGVYND